MDIVRIDIEGLISKVEINPPIWDKRIKEYSNRNIVDACWRRISSEMQMDVSILRKKWKYLRDQFCVECSKTDTETKWLYFKQMLFLKDVVRPRATFKNREASDDDTELFGDDQEMYSLDLNVEERENPDENGTSQTQPGDSNHLASSQPRKRRRVPCNKRLRGERISKILAQQRINTTDQSTSSQRKEIETENDDILFFKSLIPFVSKIQPEQKLRFRGRLLQVVEEFAFQGSGGSSSSSQQPPSHYESANNNNYHGHGMLNVTHGAHISTGCIPGQGFKQIIP